jgi:hypothetical protein
VLLNWRTGAGEEARREGVRVEVAVVLEMRGRQTAGVRRRRSMVKSVVVVGERLGGLGSCESDFLEVSRGLGFSEFEEVTWLERPQVCGS